MSVSVLALKVPGFKEQTYSRRERTTPSLEKLKKSEGERTTPPTPSLNKSKGGGENASSAGIASEGRWAEQKQSTFKAKPNVLLLPAGSGF